MLMKALVVAVALILATAGGTVFAADDVPTTKQNAATFAALGGIEAESRCDDVPATSCANAGRMSEQSDGAARWQALTPRHRQLLLAVERREAEFHAHFGHFVPAELDYLDWLSAVIGADRPDERALVLRHMRRFVEEDRSLAEARQTPQR